MFGLLICLFAKMSNRLIKSAPALRAAEVQSCCSVSVGSRVRNMRQQLRRGAAVIGRACSQRVYTDSTPSSLPLAETRLVRRREGQEGGVRQRRSGSARVQDCKKLAATPTWRNALQSAPRQNLASGQTKIEPLVLN